MIELNYKTQENTLVKVESADGYWINTNHGRLLDTVCGNMSFIFGYNNEYILDRMYAQQKKLSYLNFKHNEVCEENDELIRRLCEEGNYHGVSYAVSGTDGVECAIAINDHYWKSKDPNRKKIISFTPGYSGATRLCRALRGEHHDPDIVSIKAPEWNNIDQRAVEESKTFDQLKELIANKDVGAVLMESIPWATGIRPWSQQWWTDVRKLCTAHGVNLILDDVMGGMGKLGYRFSQHRYNIQPDIVALGKSLTGGFSPLSCACTTESISTTIRDTWDYGHTWQPNMAGVGAALAVWDIFDSDRLLKIEKRLSALAEKFVEQGFATSYVVIGLIFSINLKNPITSESFIASGLTGGPDVKYSISLCAPAIADDVYFDELEKRILACLTS